VVFSPYWTGLHLEHGDSNKTTANETKTKTTSANVTMHGKMQQVKLKFSNARISSGAAKNKMKPPKQQRGQKSIRCRISFLLCQYCQLHNMFVISFVGDSANVLVNVVGVHVIMPRNSKHETQRVTTKAEKRGSVKLKKKQLRKCVNPTAIAHMFESSVLNIWFLKVSMSESRCWGGEPS
jgi:hypothetical protein